MTKSQEESYQKKTENTKRFDAIGKKINKLLTATAGTFIPELAEALKDDWYPHLSYDIIKVNKDLQDEIRDKILSVYSYDWREGAPWANATIQNFFPDWLRNPTMQESNKENVKIASAAAAYQRKIGQQRAIFEREIEKLPEVPKELAPEPTGRYGILNEGQDQDEEESGPVEYVGEGEIAKPNEKPVLTPLESYEQGVRAAEKLWEALTNYDHLIPTDTRDPLLDFIKPSRKFRLRVFKGLDEARYNHYQRCLIWLNMVIQESLKQCLEINREDTSSKKELKN